METVIEVNIGQVNFQIEENAYTILKSYLSNLENSIHDINERAKIMDDIESRVAEIFQKNIKSTNQVITIEMVNEVKECIGEIEPTISTYSETNKKKEMIAKKLYRNPDDRKIAGVCSGLGEYFNVDTTIIRVIFIVMGLLYGSAILAYIIMWVVIPKADTKVKKMRMRGEDINSDNLNQ